MFHDTEAPGSIHIPYNWEYADATEREADTTVVTADLGKLARQLDDDSLWMLTAVTPTWKAVGTDAPVTTVNTLTGDVVLDADDVGAFSGTTKTDVLQAGAFAADAGSTDAYAATLSPAITEYVTGAHYRFKANTANTGACTINLNTLGAKTIKKAAGGITTDLDDNDIRAGQWVDLVYDGTNMQMQSLLGNTGGVGSGDMLLGTAQTVTAAKTFNAGTLKIASGGDLVDANGNELFKFTATGSAVNQFTLVNAATGGKPEVLLSGDDSNISGVFRGKGVGSTWTFYGGTSEHSQLRVDTNGASLNSTLVFLQNGVAFSSIGIAGGDDGLVTGSAAGDTCLRIVNKAYNVSLDDGTTKNYSYATNGGFRIDGTDPFVALYRSGVVKWQIGNEPSAGAIITGTAQDDLAIRSYGSKAVVISTDNSATKSFEAAANNGGIIVRSQKLTSAEATTSYASLNAPHGTAPSSPVNGDIWTTTAGLFVRINGATVGPLS